MRDGQLPAIFEADGVLRVEAFAHVRLIFVFSDVLPGGAEHLRPLGREDARALRNALTDWLGAHDQYLIWSLEHRAWWKPNAWGYTTDVVDAGTFTLEQTREIVKDSRGLEVGVPDFRSIPSPEVT